MHRTQFLMMAAVWLSVSAITVAEEADPQRVAFFEKNIRPVLVAQCYKCHSAEGKTKGGLLVDTRDGIRRGGETGHAVVPGNTEESLILSALRHEDFEMPPGNKLSSEIIANFETWIKMGAPDPREGKAGSGGKRVIDIEAGRKFWAFQPVRPPQIPAVQNAAWPLAAIDRFVLAALERAELAPVADAEAAELVRRIFFDLTGLPPSPDAVLEWTTRLTTSSAEPAAGTINSGTVNSATINQTALADLIDGLLASPQFGERWGRHWLDVVRYADSNGNADNAPFPHAWRYRNWVIDAFNADMPFDRFLVEQLAGDLLPYASPAQRNQLLVATGFLALGSKPRAQNNPNFQMDVVSEQIDVMSSAMLGLTVGCARCHDHKFDPIPTAEFYSLAGIFGSTQTLFGNDVRGNNGNRNVQAGLIELLEIDPQVAQARQEFAAKLGVLTAAQKEVTKELAKLGVNVGQAGDKKKNKAASAQNRLQIRKLQERLAMAQQNKAAAKQIAQIKKRLAELGADAEADANAELLVAKADDSSEVQALKAQLRQLGDEVKTLQEQAPPSVAQAMGVREGKPADCAICIAGESTDRGPIVPRGLISVVSERQPPQIPADASGRLQLAEWIASANNPLTARVMANRIWQHLFGKGIVASVDNFGELGERPTHPELLDCLAAEFVAGKWSVKRQIRMVMLTRAYQLSSRHAAGNYSKDPDNTWLWRKTPRRLDAEELRDAILAFSGEIEMTRGGAETGGSSPPQSRTNGRFRSMYLPVVRNGEPEVFRLFDFADPSIVVGAREETTVPAQSLFLLNNEFVVRQSRAAAARILKDVDGDKLDRVFLFAYGRRPTAAQRTRSEQFLQEMQNSLSESEQNAQRRELSAWSALCQSLIASAEFRYLD